MAKQKTIIIEGNLVKEVRDGYLSLEQAGAPKAKVINLKDKFVMPDLMDMHVHLTRIKGKNSGSDDIALAGVSNARKTLMAGFTTVRDLGAMGDTIFKLRKKIQKGEIVGPRIYAAGQIIGVGARDHGLDWNGPESCRRTARTMVQKGANLIKIYSSCSSSKFCSKQDGKPMFFEDELDAIFAVAKKFGVKVAAHSHPRDSALQVLQYDLGSIEHGSFMNNKALKTMKKKNVFFVPTVAVHDMIENKMKDKKLDGRTRAHNQKFLDNHPETIQDAYAMGVKLATGRY